MSLICLYYLAELRFLAEPKLVLPDFEELKTRLDSYDLRIGNRGKF